MQEAQWLAQRIDYGIFRLHKVIKVRDTGINIPRMVLAAASQTLDLKLFLLNSKND